MLKALQWLLIPLRTTFSNRLWPTGSTTPWPSVPSRLTFFYCSTAFLIRSSHMSLLAILRYSFHQSLAPRHTPSITSVNSSMSALKCHFFGGLFLASPSQSRNHLPLPPAYFWGCDLALLFCTALITAQSYHLLLFICIYPCPPLESKCLEGRDCPCRSKLFWQLLEQADMNHGRTSANFTQLYSCSFNFFKL